jgi:16S rRNA (guanine527-N7)-methyltransferase
MDDCRARVRALFGLDLGRDELDKLSLHLDAIEEWSTRMNLVAALSRGELVERHVVDSLALEAFVATAGRVADFGSGAGFPAIPLAIVSPATEFHLIESRMKRATFLRHVARTLRLANVRVWDARGEAWEPPAPIDVVTGRALRLETLAALASRTLARNGKMAVMRKWAREVPALTGFVVARRSDYVLREALRHEVIVYERR